MFLNWNWLNSSVLSPAGTFERAFCLASFNFCTNAQQMFSFISCVISPTLHILAYCFWQWWKAGISWPFVFRVLHKFSCSFQEYFLLLSCSCFVILKVALEIPSAIAVLLELQFKFRGCVCEKGTCTCKRKVVMLLLGSSICKGSGSWMKKRSCQFSVTFYLEIVHNCCLKKAELSLIVVWGRQKSRTIGPTDGDNPVKLYSLCLYEYEVDLYSNLGVLSSLSFASYL